MSTSPKPALRLLAAAALSLGAPRVARAFLGIADTSFVTVIANPAEAANSIAKMEKLVAAFRNGASSPVHRPNKQRKQLRRSRAI